MIKVQRERLLAALEGVPPLSAARIGEEMLRLADSCESGLAGSILREVAQIMGQPALDELERVLG